MAKWIDIGPTQDFPVGSKNCLTAADRKLVVMNVDGELFAVANVCPHAGLPLGDGDLYGKVLTCPYHGYAYNVQTGRNVDFPHEELPVTTFHVRVENGTVQVNVPAKKMAND